MSTDSAVIRRRALRVLQDPKHALYLFTLSSAELLQIADISRVSRDEAGKLIGYQRPEVKRHVKGITDYVDSGEVLFPNSIILALSSAATFKEVRGPKVDEGLAEAGTLEIPLPLPGQPKPAWIVDGQQRALALSRSKRQGFPVPISAFVADDLESQKEQFLRINNTQPLPRGLVNELLPDVDTVLPSHLAARQAPARLCELLNRDPESPFLGLIHRSSTSRSGQGKGHGERHGHRADDPGEPDHSVRVPLPLPEHRDGRDRLRGRSHGPGHLLERREGGLPGGLGTAARPEPPDAWRRYPGDGAPHGPSDELRPGRREERSPTREARTAAGEGRVPLDGWRVGGTWGTQVERGPERPHARQGAVQLPRACLSPARAATQVKFFFPDSQDLVDPGFDFERERWTEDRVRQRDDRYAHEVFKKRAFDGLLVSKGIVDGFGETGSRYSIGQRQRLLRNGVREFFRLDKAPYPLPVIGDCGAFTYVNEPVPPYTVDEVIEFYTECRFDLGISVDHVILDFQAKWDADEALVPAPVRERQEVTLTLAADFLKRHKSVKAPFEPLGVAQGWSPKSYARAVAALQKMGYRYIAMGGMVPLKTPEILLSLDAVARVRKPATKLHLLGVTRTESIPRFAEFGVASFDSTSPLRQAFKDARDNYYTLDRAYTAIRIPQVDGNATLQKLILSGVVDQAEARRLEKALPPGHARPRHRQDHRRQGREAPPGVRIARPSAQVGLGRQQAKGEGRRERERLPGGPEDCPLEGLPVRGLPGARPPRHPLPWSRAKPPAWLPQPVRLLPAPPARTATAPQGRRLTHLQRLHGPNPIQE